MKFLIMGRTCRGKDTLRNLLETQYDWKFGKSYTTRPKRGDTDPGAKNYHFITSQEAAQVPEKNKILKTIIGDYEYFLTKEEIASADALILDPNGFYEIQKQLPDEILHVLYLQADDEKAKEVSMQRGNPEQMLAQFQERSQKENKIFSDFEHFIKNLKTDIGSMPRFIIDTVENDYQENTISYIAYELDAAKQYYTNMLPLLQDLIQSGKLNHDMAGNVVISTKTQDTLSVTPEHFSQLIYRPYVDPTVDVFLFWLRLKTTHVVPSVHTILPRDDTAPELIQSILDEPFFKKVIDRFHEKPDPKQLYESLLHNENFRTAYRNLLCSFISDYFLSNVPEDMASS